MRKPEKGPVSTERRSKESCGIIDETRRYRFLTQVMGGGVQVKDHEKLRDERTPIRAASIRGQLRFWWRACNPRNCDSVENLHAAEAEVWGSSEKPSPIVIQVIADSMTPKQIDVYEYVEKRQKDGSTKTVFQAREGMKELAYASFPLQPNEKLRKDRTRAGILYDYGKSEFTIRFSYPEGLKEDVQTALWAWETFGGLGARTRRGFGAVENIGVTRSLDDIRRVLVRIGKHERIDGVPSLNGAEFAVAKDLAEQGLAAWQQALKMLQQLRQGLGVGRNRGPGRSLWPEADAIRGQTKETLPAHSTRLVHVDAFPRAYFGLPIIFHFKDGPRSPGEKNRDPADTELKPTNADRMASPLILRPIRDGRGYRAAALRLHCPTPPGGIVLKTKTREIPVKVDLTAAEAKSIPPLAGKTNPVVRFLEELKK